MPKTIFINIDNYQFQILLSQFNQNILIRRDGFSVFISEKEIKDNYSMSVLISEELNINYLLYKNVLNRVSKLRMFL